MASRDIARLTRKIIVLGKKKSEAVQSELIGIADDIVAEQKVAAPKKTGRLASTIRRTGLRQSRTGTTVYVRAGGKATTSYESSGKPGGIDYAVEQEFGNENMDANSFFYPVIRRNQKKIRDRVSKAFKRDT